MKVIDQINESGFFAQSAYSADTATNDSLGRNISETYQTTAGMTAYQPSGDYLSSKGFTQRITNPSNNKFISFWNEAGGSTATAQPAIYLNGQFGSAYYKDNELKIGRNNHTIAFNIGGSGPKISAAATGTVESFMYVYNAGNSATISESGFNLKNSTANENVTIASIQSWNAKGDMHASSFSYDGNNKISAYNGSAFSVEQVITSTGGNANYVNRLNNKGISAMVSYKARLDEGNHSISALYDTVSTNSASWETVTTSAGIIGNGTTESPLMTDETVLYSGTRNVSGVLNDSPFNYDRIRIYLDLGHQGENPSRSDQAFEFPMRGTTADSRVNMFYAKGYSNAWFSVMQVAFTPTYFSAVRCKSINMGPFNTTTTTFTANLNSDEDMKAIVQVVGINKINNG